MNKGSDSTQYEKRIVRYKFTKLKWKSDKYLQVNYTVIKNKLYFDHKVWNICTSQKSDL